MRIESRGSRRALLAALFALTCGGCGVAGGGSSADLIPVKGKVTYKGQPVTQGRIRFTPDDGFGRPAFGPIQSDGTFVLTTVKERDGVVSGHHRVSILETGIKSPRDALAKKWASPGGSGLTADVNAEHTEFAFDLK